MTESSLRDEALRLVDVASERGVPLRVLGGAAIELLVPAWKGRGDRPGRDLDLATSSSARPEVLRLLEGEGYVPDRRYNAAAGHKQLYAVDPTRGRPVDVIIDRLEMCHAIDLRGSIAAAGPTILPADLLLTKLQVVKVTRKDIVDALVLLSDLPLVEAAGEGNEGIAMQPIIRLTSGDWGWWRTSTATLDTLIRFVEEEPAAEELQFSRPPRLSPSAQARELRRRIDDAPKSLGWKARARVGDRVRWYEEPEEETHA